MKRMLKMPSGRYLTAAEKNKKAIVPVKHLISNVQRKSSLISLKKLILAYFMIIAEPHMLKKERKNTNS